MINLNPMFKKDIALKVHTTLSKLRTAGKLKLDFTKSKRYKGDRGIKNYIRIELYPWRQKCLAEAQFCCENCGT